VNVVSNDQSGPCRMRSYSPETIGVMTDERQRRCHEDAGAHQLGNRATVRSAICWPCRRTSVPEQSGGAPLHHRRKANGPRRSFNTARPVSCTGHFRV
jgi:hypothetical protein